MEMNTALDAEVNAIFKERRTWDTRIRLVSRDGSTLAAVLRRSPQTVERSLNQSLRYHARTLSQTNATDRFTDRLILSQDCGVVCVNQGPSDVYPSRSSQNKSDAWVCLYVRYV